VLFLPLLCDSKCWFDMTSCAATSKNDSLH
jgi:hypothetical protein